MTRRPLAIAATLFALSLPLSAHSADLLQAYEMARESDPQFSAAEANTRATREGRVQARAALLPQIDASATYNRSESAGTSLRSQVDEDTGRLLNFPVTSSSETRRRSYDATVRQMVYDHANITRLRSQNALSEAGDYQLESAGDTLITRTSQAYFDVLVAMETLSAAEAQEAALKKQFDFADKRLEVGLAPITDVHEARAQYDRARANTIVVRNALEDSYRALEEITGTDARDLKALPQDFQPELPVDLDADGWVSTAIDNNPALKAAEYRLKSAEANIATARAGHYPTLYLSGSYGDDKTWGDSRSRGEVFPNDSEGYGPSIGLTLNVPIYAGGATQSQVRQAIAQRDAASDELEQQKRALVRNTRNAYRTLVAGISEVEARKAAVFSARSAYDASQVGLEVGTRTVLDVLNNQQTLFNAEQEYARSRYNFLQNRLLLEQAAGTLDIDDVREINRLLTAEPRQPATP